MKNLKDKIKTFMIGGVVLLSLFLNSSPAYGGNLNNTMSSGNSTRIEEVKMEKNFGHSGKDSNTYSNTQESTKKSVEDNTMDKIIVVDTDNDGKYDFYLKYSEKNEQGLKKIGLSYKVLPGFKINNNLYILENGTAKKVNKIYSNIPNTLKDNLTNSNLYGENTKEKKKDKIKVGSEVKNFKPNTIVTVHDINGDNQPDVVFFKEFDKNPTKKIAQEFNFGKTFKIPILHDEGNLLKGPKYEAVTAKNSLAQKEDNKIMIDLNSDGVIEKNEVFEIKEDKIIFQGKQIPIKEANSVLYTAAQEANNDLKGIDLNVYKLKEHPLVYSSLLNKEDVISNIVNYLERNVRNNNLFFIKGEKNLYYILKKDGELYVKYGNNKYEKLRNFLEKNFNKVVSLEDIYGSDFYKAVVGELKFDKKEHFELDKDSKKLDDLLDSSSDPTKGEKTIVTFPGQNNLFLINTQYFDNNNYVSVAPEFRGIKDFNKFMKGYSKIKDIEYTTIFTNSASFISGYSLGHAITYGGTGIGPGVLLLTSLAYATPKIEKLNDAIGWSKGLSSLYYYANLNTGNIIKENTIRSGITGFLSGLISGMIKEMNKSNGNYNQGHIESTEGGPTANNIGGGPTANNIGGGPTANNIGGGPIVSQQQAPYANEINFIIGGGPTVSPLKIDPKFMNTGF